IGGATPSAGNVIGGWTTAIVINGNGGGTYGNAIEQNHIGVSAGGASIPNETGISLSFDGDSATGGDSILNNLLCRNGGDAIDLSGSIATVIQGNRIGVLSDGTPLGNNGGISL